MTRLYRYPLDRDELPSLVRAAEEYLSYPGVRKSSIRELAAGEPAGVFYDIDVALQQPAQGETIARIFATEIAAIADETPVAFLAFLDKGIHGGTTIGAIQLAVYLSIELQIPFFQIRPQKAVEYDRVNLEIPGTPMTKRLAGKSGVLVTDHVTSGNEIVDAVEDVVACGGSVHTVLTHTLERDHEREVASRLKPYGTKLKSAILVSKESPDYAVK